MYSSASMNWGSSPLTRGKPSAWVNHSLTRGLIPAHAGKTPRRTRECLGGGAHPRSRGENDAAGASRSSRKGSSPLTRGKPHHLPGGQLGGGLIPAHAGKTAGGPRRGRGAWAHPRSRGENISALPSSTRRMGSSPLTRGKRGLPVLHPSMTGLIPAHAGKTCSGAPGGR